MRLLTQPSELYILSFGELCERFSYYGTQAILVLYLSKIFLFSDSHSYSIYGVYTTLAFALPVLGGILADRFLGFRNAIISGALLLIIGNLLLVTSNFYLFCLGLAMSVCGTGLYKGNSTGLVGTLYKENDPRRESGFTILYMGMNIGATLGAIIYGLAASILGWHYGFIFSAVGIAISTSIFIKNKHFYAFQNVQYSNAINLHNIAKSGFKTQGLIYILILLACVFTSVIFHQPKLLSGLLFFIATILAWMFITAVLKYKKIERNRLIVLLIFAFFAMLFFTASLQVGSSISLFINRDINRILLGWQIPTVLFSSLYPLAVILIAPLFTVLWRYLATHQKEPAVPVKLSLGLLFASIGFICFAQATHSSMHNFLGHSPLVWILLGNLCLGAGELIIFPTLLSTISRLAPQNLQGTMMGICFLFVAFAGYLSSVVAKFSDHSQILISPANTLLSLNIYNNTFNKIAIATLVTAILICILTPWLKSMMAQPKKTTSLTV